MQHACACAWDFASHPEWSEPEPELGEVCWKRRTDQVGHLSVAVRKHVSSVSCNYSIPWEGVSFLWAWNWILFPTSTHLQPSRHHPPLSFGRLLNAQFATATLILLVTSKKTLTTPSCAGFSWRIAIILSSLGSLIRFLPNSHQRAGFSAWPAIHKNPLGNQVKYFPCAEISFSCHNRAFTWQFDPISPIHGSLVMLFQTNISTLGSVCLNLPVPCPILLFPSQIGMAFVSRKSAGYVWGSRTYESNLPYIALVGRFPISASWLGHTAPKLPRMEILLWLAIHENSLGIRLLRFPWYSSCRVFLQKIWG